MKSTPRSPAFSRRRFIALASAAAVAPTIIPASALGRGKHKSPNGRITMGVVGWGMMGPGNTAAFLKEQDCQVVAACDLDSIPLKSAVDTINKHYGNSDCKAYHDYREMMSRDDIDTVMLAVPDHWHALTAVEACRQGKDVYGEKPLARTIVEQQEIVRAVHDNKRIWQTGSWQRSGPHFRRAAEIVRNNLIGKITHVEVGLPGGHVDFKKTGMHMTPTAPPSNLDYEMWIGPSKMMPYIEARVHMNWRWNYNTGGGQLLDWVGHHVDIAHWALNFDDAGPYEIEGHGEFPANDAVWNTATKYRINLKYPHDITMTIAGGHDDIKSGTKWYGTDGWVWVDRGGFDCSNPDWKKTPDLPDDLAKIKLYRSEEHHRNFLDCVKSRKPTVTPAKTAHHSAIPGHLGLISMLVNRKIQWNHIDEIIVGDKEASKLLARDYRSPWSLNRKNIFE